MKKPVEIEFDDNLRIFKGKGRKKARSEQEIRDIHAEWLGGGNLDVVAKSHTIDPRTLKAYFDFLKLPPKDKEQSNRERAERAHSWNAPSEQKVQEMHLFYIQGNSLDDTSAKFNYDSRYIKKLFLKYNLPIKSHEQRESERVEKQKESLRDLYGVEAPSQIESARQKQKEHWERCRETGEIEGIVAKRKETCLERYGVENPSQLEEVHQKKLETHKKHYGVEYSLQRPELMEKILAERTEKQITLGNKK